MYPSLFVQFYIFVLNHANKIEIKTESKLLLVRNSYMYIMWASVNTKLVLNVTY